MRKRWYALSLAVIATAVPLQAAQPPAELHAVELQVTIGDHSARMVALEGSRPRIVTTAGEVLELAVSVEPAERGDSPRVTLESYQVFGVGPTSSVEQASFLSGHLLEMGASAIVFSGSEPIQAELLAVHAVAEPDNLRPRDQCCIACPDSPSTCACAVETPCGSCSAPGCT